MKRIRVFIILIMLIGVGASPAFAQQEDQQPITVYMDGLLLDFDVEPIIQNDRTLVPFRVIAEALNVTVTWDQVNRMVIAETQDISVHMTIDSNIARVNNCSVEMDTCPIIYKDRTLLPARFFSEVFGCTVNWDADSRRVEIASPPAVMKVVGFYALGDEKTSSWTDLFNVPYPQAEEGNTGIISDLALGWFTMDEAGNLLTRSNTGWQRPQGWENVIKTAFQYNLTTQMVVHMTDGEGKMVRFLNNQEAVERGVVAIASQVQDYQGVNLDFEGLGLNETEEELQKTRADFTYFVSRLSQELKKAGKELTLTLHAPNSAYQGYDYKTLGELADYIVIMAYDYGQRPEPVKMVAQAIEQAKSAVPAEKLLLGISAASENSQSVVTKIGLAKMNNLKGIALWRLGIISDEIWEVLKASIIKPSEL